MASEPELIEIPIVETKEESDKVDGLSRLIQYLKQRANDKNHLKRGIYRIGMVISGALTGITLVMGIVCMFTQGSDILHYVLIFTLLFAVIFFSLPILLARGIS